LLVFWKIQKQKTALYIIDYYIFIARFKTAKKQENIQSNHSDNYLQHRLTFGEVKK
jgi:hypothetical protein